MMEIHTMQCIALRCNDTISKRKGCILHGCHTNMHTKMLQWWYIQFMWNQSKRITWLWSSCNDGKILGREKPVSKYPYKDKMAEGRLSEQKVPFQDTKIPNLVATDQSVIKTRAQTTTMTSCSPRQKGSSKYILNRIQQITMASF